jgi:hypothetical protein
MILVDEIAKINRQAAFNALCKTSLWGDPESKSYANGKLARKASDDPSVPWPTDEVVASTEPPRPVTGLQEPGVPAGLFLYGGSKPASSTPIKRREELRL